MYGKNLDEIAAFDTHKKSTHIKVENNYGMSGEYVLAEGHTSLAYRAPLTAGKYRDNVLRLITQMAKIHDNV